MLNNQMVMVIDGKQLKKKIWGKLEEIYTNRNLS